MTTFIAPTSHDEAETLIGRDIETPIGVLRCTGAGLHGVAGTVTERYSINFHVTKGKRADIEISWSSDEGWVTKAQRRMVAWNAGWDRLPKNARALITKVMGGDVDATSVDRRKDAVKLLRIAKRRLIKAGKIALRNCGRCGGGGEYSYHPMHGTKCFGCGGTGKVLPATGACLKAMS